MSLTSLLLGTSFQNPWGLLYKLQIEMRHRKIGSAIGIGFMAAAPLSRQWIFFLRRFQDIPCDTVAESIEIIIKIAYISCFFRRNGQLSKCLHDIFGKKSPLGQSNKISARRTGTVPLRRAVIPGRSRRRIDFKAEFAQGKPIYFTHLLSLFRKSGCSDMLPNTRLFSYCAFGWHFLYTFCRSCLASWEYM